MTTSLDVREAKILPMPQPPQPEPFSGRKLNSLRLAKILLNEWKDELRYFRSAWHKYEGGYWQAQENEAIDLQIYSLLERYEDYNPALSRASEIHKYLRTKLKTRDDLVDGDADWINFKNGSFNLRTWEFTEHKPEHYFTSQLAYEYDAGAVPDAWFTFINQTLVDPEGKPDWKLIQLVQEAFGYSLTADMSFRVSFWVHGPTGSGKSTLINLLASLASSYHAPFDLNQLASGAARFMLAQAAGKRLITFGEADANTRLADGLYKMLVSSDEIVADVKNREPIRFKPTAKIWWGMNNLPVNVDRSGAVDSRVIIIPMKRSIPAGKKDLRLAEKLERELPGIFNWAAQGLQRLYRAGKFTDSAQVEEAKEEYRRTNDVELQFVEDALDKNNQARTSSQVLYDEYREWCMRNGFKPKAHNTITRDWERLGFKKVESGGKKFWAGCSLKKME